MKIAISKASGSKKYERYAPWLRRVRGDTDTVDLAPITSLEATRVIRECSGLLLTGGEDIEPWRYGMREKASLCTCDPTRDTLEWALLEEALKRKMPILGICRGMQLINVFFGGTLITDISLDVPGSMEHRGEEDDARHTVSIVRGSLLENIVGTMEDEVASSHHQAVEKVAQGFCISAKAPDGVSEALECEDSEGKPFLLGVQWHPERMVEGSSLSIPLARRFVLEAEGYTSSQ